jgi:2-polyprenyl-3-methyl-5-hydroxy-6-metoxy-1,4-benzoquinol methylase
MASQAPRERLYSRYLSTHAVSRGGAAEERGRFPAFDAYFAKLLPADTSAPILDIGCGHGLFLRYLAERGYTNAAGVDASLEQVEAAHALGVPNVRCADARAVLRSQNNSIGLITALDVLEHFQKVEVMDLLDAAYNALEPDGILLIQTANAESPLFGAIRYGDFTHEIAFTSESISQVLSAAGFVQIEVRAAGPVPHGITSALRTAIWWIAVLSLRLIDAAETGRLSGQIFTRNLIAVARRPRAGGPAGSNSVVRSGD